MRRKCKIKIVTLSKTLIFSKFRVSYKFLLRILIGSSLDDPVPIVISHSDVFEVLFWFYVIQWKLLWRAILRYVLDLQLAYNHRNIL